MIEDGTSYKLAKYADMIGNTASSSTTDVKVGLLRMGELMAEYFDRGATKGGNSSTVLTTDYWILTSYSSRSVNYLITYGTITEDDAYYLNEVCPSLNLKSNVVIASLDGTKNNLFALELAS